MGRPHIEFIQAFDVEPGPAADSRPFAGCAERLLSSDEETSAYTALIDVPSGWVGRLGGERPIELFALSGFFRIGDEPFGPGCYAFFPSISRQMPVSVGAPGLLLAMVEAPNDGTVEEEFFVKDTTSMRWAASKFAEVPAGLVNKRLRDDPATGERTWVAACPAGWVEERAEVHPTVEESFTLRGDILLGRLGGMGPGCYFWRPPMVPHGPMYSRGGAEFFFRTKGGTLEVTYETVPGWDAMVDSYRAREPLYNLPNASPKDV